MTAKEAAFDLLKRQKDLPEGDLSVQKQQWLEALRDLMTRIRSWLQPAVSEGLLLVEAEEVRIVEERLRIYLAPGLQVFTPRGDRVSIVPKARYVVGADGRVDMDCPPKRVILLRHRDKGWQICRLAASHAGWSHEELNEESFWAHFKELLS